ncbi:GNAT family N-acetyltransferase [Streptomyces collinus]|uniref:GNAT family N-acetyltransferase n=1 Tax=Streptomyces collinus TaxID=42684 RepID=UPI003689D756
MRFRWDWIEPVLSVPYVPTLGPARPDDPLHAMFEAVVAAAGTGEFLPFDKDARWFDSKAEHVLVEHIRHDPHRTLIPTLVQGRSRTVKVHVYGNDPDSRAAGAALARKLAAVHGVPRACVVWFLGPHVPAEEVRGIGTRVQLKTFDDGPGAKPDVQVLDYKQLREPEWFAAFAGTMKEDGFAFLYDQMRSCTVGPVLTVVDEGTVAGAIGPMETMGDVSGRARLLPQYFGVLPEYRGLGYGRALWRAAMHWGYEHGAAYQLLQTEVGGTSDRLCAAEGLRSLGFVNQSTV